MNKNNKYNNNSKEKRESNKMQEKQVMHNEIAHHLLTDAQPGFEQQLTASNQLPTLYILLEYPFG